MSTHCLASVLVGVGQFQPDERFDAVAELVGDPGGELDALQFGQPATRGNGRDPDALRAVLLLGCLEPRSAGGVTDDDGQRLARVEGFGDAGVGGDVVGDGLDQDMVRGWLKYACIIQVKSDRRQFKLMRSAHQWSRSGVFAEGTVLVNRETPYPCSPNFFQYCRANSLSSPPTSTSWARNSLARCQSLLVCGSFRASS